MTSNDHHVVVAGGGIGGLSAALCLSRRGFDVTVLERGEAFTEIGAGIQLAPNATRVLQKLGLLGRIVDEGVLPKRLVLASALTGEELTSLPLDDFTQRYGAPYVVIHRGDLLSALYDACRESLSIELLASKTVVRALPGDEVAVAECEDGSALEGIALVGADGLHSVVRPHIVLDEAVFSGYVAYRGSVALEAASRPADLDDVVAFIGPGLHFVQYPLRRRTLYNQVAVFQSRRYLAGDAQWGDEKELEERFESCCSHVREALRSIHRDASWPMFDREPVGSWSRGNLVLLGDAAHPMLQYLAQGACQAIEDADALGRAMEPVRSGRRGVAEAIASYQAERIPHTAQVQRRARAWGDIWHVDGTMRSLRDAYLRERAPGDHRHTGWLYGEPGANGDRSPAAAGASTQAGRG
jgi:salicylate hydroxylase